MTFVNPNGISDIYLYNPTTNTVRTPYTEMFKKLKMYTPTQGRSRILPNGDVYVEETDYCRLLRLAQDRVRWIFVNTITEKTVGSVHWVRYYNPEEIDLSWLKQ